MLLHYSSSYEYEYLDVSVYSLHSLLQRVPACTRPLLQRVPACAHPLLQRVTACAHPLLQRVPACTHPLLQRVPVCSTLVECHVSHGHEDLSQEVVAPEHVRVPDGEPQGAAADPRQRYGELATQRQVMVLTTTVVRGTGNTASRVMLLTPDTGTANWQHSIKSHAADPGHRYGELATKHQESLTAVRGTGNTASKVILMYVISM